MKINTALAMTLALVASAQAAVTVRVCVNPETYVSAFVLTRSQAIASRMFATAGVTLEWHSDAPAVCQGLQPTKTVILDFTKNTPTSQHPGALAYALPYEAVHIVVLFDRVEKSSNGPGQVSTLLAHVMTHEITHVLQGIARHSAAGVMKAHWNTHDFIQMAYKPLPFAPEDIDLIQRGLHTPAADPVGSHATAQTTKSDGRQRGEE